MAKFVIIGIIACCTALVLVVVVVVAVAVVFVVVVAGVLVALATAGVCCLFHFLRGRAIMSTYMRVCQASDTHKHTPSVLEH